MNHPLYLQAAVAISPQHSYDRTAFLRPVLQSANGRLNIIPADFAQHIPPVAIRRMSIALKAAISAGMQCLAEANVATPDAIITGTGRGSVTDMETMVKDLIRLDEEALNPTLFIQSTYNSPNGWLAMLSKCTRYNQTYLHRGSSLELALLDAQALIAEGSASNILTGCYDELTEEYFIMKRKVGYWKSLSPESSLRLLAHSDTPGSIGGEGAAFFLLTGDKGAAATGLAALKMVQNANPATVNDAVNEVLSHAGAGTNNIDFVLTGMSGDARYQPLYAFLEKFDASKTGLGAFKHLCGEYDTATGFGLWLADHLLRTQKVPEEILIDGSAAPVALTNILLVNHYLHGSASVILLQKVS